MPPFTRPRRSHGEPIIEQDEDDQLASSSSPTAAMRPSQTVSDLEPAMDEHHQQRPQHRAQQRQFDDDEAFEPIEYDEQKPIEAAAQQPSAVAASSSRASVVDAAASSTTSAPAAACLPPRERGLDGSLITSMQRLTERQNLVRVLSCNLEQLCPMGAPLPGNPLFLSLFHTSAMPGISIREYMERLSIYTAVSEEAMIQACMHIVRLAHNGRIEAEHRESARATNPSNPTFLPSAVAIVHGTPHPRINSFSAEPFQVSCFNIHRLLLTALLVTAKYSDDAFHNNKLFSSLGGITLRELNQLELEFLSLLDFKMTVDIHEFTFMYAHVFNNPARHGIACCQSHHPMGPNIVCEEQPGCDNPVLDSDIEQARLWHQQQQELEQHQQLLAAAAASAAAKVLAPTPSHLYPQASPTASPSLAYQDRDGDCMIDGAEYDMDTCDQLRSTGSSVTTSPHQRSVSHQGRYHASSVSASSSSSSACGPMASPDATATVHKEVLWENIPSAVGNEHKRKKEQQQQQQPDLSHLSPASSSCSSLGLRRISAISLHSVTHQQGATPSPSLSHREYSRKTFGPAGSSARAAAAAAAIKRGEMTKVVDHTHQTRGHAAYLARHGVATLWSPSPVDSQQPQQGEDYDVMM